MPLKLIEPRKGKSPNYSIRGTYLGVYVDRSAGTHRRPVAADQLRQLERRIERGEFPEKPADPAAPTFLSAAVAYMKARPQTRARARYIGRLIQHFGETLLPIDQAAIDNAAIVLYPNATAPSRTAYVYTPVSAILHHAGSKTPVRRPKGYKGRTVTDHLVPADAFGIIAAAQAIDIEFALLLKFLLYTGVRVSEALALRPEDVVPDERFAWIRRSKNGDPRTLRLRDDLAAELATHQCRRPGRVFRFHQGGHLAHMLNRAKLAALGVPCPRRRPPKWRPQPYRLSWVNFHSFRHTWATWMRRYGGLDLQGLVATNNWRNIRSAQRYAHVVAREEWGQVENLPAAGESGERPKRAG